MNTRLQTNLNSELKGGSYSLLNQSYAKGMQLRDEVQANLFLVVLAQFLGLFLSSFCGN